MNKHLLKIFRLRAVMLVALLCAGISGAWGQSDYSNDYTGNITLSTTGGTSATECVVRINNNNYDGIKAGTGSVKGVVKITVPKYTKYLHLHSAGWKGETVELSVKMGNNDVTTIDLTSNDGISNSTPFVFNGNANTESYYKIITFSNALSDDKELTFTATKGKRFVIWGVTAEAINQPRHTATFSINGETSTQSIVEGAAIPFPTVPANIYGKTFVGWTTTEINGEQNNAPAMVSSATMGTADVTYYAVYANESTSEQVITKTYGFENSDVADEWNINGPNKDNSYHKTGSSSGRINTNHTYVTFREQVKVTEFSFEFMRTSTNSNYNVYIETSPDNSTWTAVETYAMSSFSTAGTWYNRSHAFDGNTPLYVRFHCYNTTATRFVDDVTIKYKKNITTHYAYCTTIPNTAAFTLSENCYDLNNGTKTYYGTYSNPSAFVVPEGVKAHTVSVANGVLSVTDYEAGAVVPANTGVMVSSSTAGEKTVNLTNENGSAMANNMLKTTGAGITADAMAAANSGCKFYYLTMNGSQIGFYRRNDTGSAFEMPVANKAYLAVPEGQVGNIKDFSFNDIVDGIKAVETTETESKAIYNLAGQRVSKMQKGIYIVNGKKVLVK